MYIADLHIHSRYSRATSKECTPEYLDLWARRKGIHIVGSGDFTHPAWREELREKLTPAEDGLYVLKKEYRIEDDTAADTMQPRFVITGEISSIYKKNGRVRKVHSLILLPGLEDAQLLSQKLETIGNIHSDGRPILGLDCRDLLEILLELCPGAIYVPAHIWTPHFSLFGAFSGFDSVEECYGDLSSHICAMETGLSADPPMIWRVSALDRYQLISNSDAHSPGKLGREANLLDIELSYQGLYDAIQKGEGLRGTIEFFPEEGKYHYDGHRKCNLCLSPSEAEKYQGICPVCGQKLTIGVCHRVEQLSDREEGYVKENAAAYESLVPLPEAIGAAVGYAPLSAKIKREYENMLRRLGPEFLILRELPIEEIRSVSGHLISEGIRRLRKGEVMRIPGFDGEYGVVRLFTQRELAHLDGQMSLFDSLPEGASKEDASLTKTEDEPLPKPVQKEAAESPAADAYHTPNARQLEAVRATERITAVAAGPGTGKTQTLVSHILYLLEERRVKPSHITAVTFTNQAAKEMRERIKKQLAKGKSVKQMQIGTFHSIALKLLRDRDMDFAVAGEMELRDMAEDMVKEFGLDMGARQLLNQISQYKTGMCKEDAIFGEVLEEYQKRLKDMKAMDFDDLLLEALHIAQESTNEGSEDGKEEQFAYLLVDEFQDINPLQYQLIKAWNKRGRELFVIGDKDQAIYGFRGASAKCFERLSEDFGLVKTITLEENYRSTPQILALAMDVISKNPGGARTLIPRLQEGVSVRLVEAESEMAEAIFVAKEINRLAGGIGMLEAQEVFAGGNERAKSFGEIAVLYRTHRQAEILETCLKKEGIPYIVAGRDDFLMDSSVRGTVSFFRSLLSPKDHLARQLALRLLWNHKGAEPKEECYEKMAEKYMPFLQKKKPQKVLDEWVEESGVKDSKAMQKLGKMALFYPNMQVFLQALETGVESDLKRVGGRRYTGDAVTLMSLHGSKGMEFPAVIIYGARAGLLPFEGGKYPADIQEERRLFYVGITRAREDLILTFCKEKSLFLKDAAEGLYVREKADRRKHAAGGRQMSVFDFLK